MAEGKDLLRVFVLIISIIIYVFVLPIIGYRIATIIFLAASLWIFGLRNKISFVLITGCIPLGVFYLFQILLKVQLP